MKIHKIASLPTLLLILSLSLLVSTNHQSSFLTPAQAQSSTSSSANVVIAPECPIGTSCPNGTGIADLGHKLSSITYDVNVSSSPSAIQGFGAVIQYSQAILDPSGVTVDLTGNVIGPVSQNQLVIECVGLNSLIGTTCPKSAPADQPPFSTVEITLTAIGHPTQTRGLLFRLTFTSIATGFAQLHVYTVALIGPSGQIPANPPQDSYYTNIACPISSTTPCQPLQVGITVTPPQPSRDGIANFTATVVDRNAGAKIVRYSWNFGDDTGNNIGFPPTNPSIVHTFIVSTAGKGSCVGGGNCTVTSTVVDNESVAWSTLILVSIRSLLIKVGVGAIQIETPPASSGGSAYYYPGTQIRITAYLSNTGALEENATLAVTVEGRQLNSSTFSNVSPYGGTASETATWNTTGLPARYYNVLVTVSNVVTSGKVGVDQVPLYGQNQTGTASLSVNPVHSSVYVLLRDPIVTGALSLNLIETTGLGLLVVIGGSMGIARFRRKPSYESEPL